MPRRLQLLLVALPALGLGLSACSSSIEQDELERQVSSTIESRFGVAADVSCPRDLEAEVDDSTDCNARDPDSGEEIALHIAVTSVEVDSVSFDIVPVE